MESPGSPLWGVAAGRHMGLGAGTGDGGSSTDQSLATPRVAHRQHQLPLGAPIRNPDSQAPAQTS